MTFKTFKKIATNILLLILVALCIIYQEQISGDIYNSLVRCVTRIIPSLFAMTVLTGIIQKCGVIDRLFSSTKIDTKLLSCFIFGNFGGYPIGAKTISDLVRSNSISKDRAENAICFSFSCGPAFAIAVSYAVYGNNICGLVAFVSILLSNIILYLVKSIENKHVYKSSADYTEFSTGLIVSSVSNAANAMIGITAMIAAFSAVTSLLKCVLPHIFISFVPSVFEISNISNLNHVSLPLLTGLLAFGGICVQTQIISIVNGALSLKKFFLSRLLQIPLAVVISAVLDMVFKLSDSVSVSAPNIHISQSYSIVPLVCMCAMLSIVFITKTKQRTT